MSEKTINFSVNVDQKLGLNKYEVDEGNPHRAEIQIRQGRP